MLKYLRHFIFNFIAFLSPGKRVFTLIYSIYILQSDQKYSDEREEGTLLAYHVSGKQRTTRYMHVPIPVHQYKVTALPLTLADFITE